MAGKQFSDLGRQMSDAVQDALRSGDFTRLKQTVDTTMHTVVDKTVSYGKHLEQSLEETAERVTQNVPQWMAQAGVPGVKKDTPPQKPWRVRYKDRLRRASAGRAKAAIMLAMGIMCVLPLGIVVASLLIFGIQQLTAPSAVVGAISAGAYFAMLALFLLPFAVTCVWVVKSARSFRRLGRYRQYCTLLEESPVCQVEMLAKAVEKPQLMVQKELRNMMDKGMIPECYMDEQETCVMLGAENYRLYQESIAAMKQRELEAAAIRQTPEELLAVITAGKECLRIIREANDALPGEVISNKLYRLETVTGKIFAYVERRPEKLPEIRRFMDYYLPTTIKLVSSYREFASHRREGEPLSATQTEILEILDTINVAFETLLNSLFQDDAMDISTDISALKTMLAQEGLSQNDFG